MVGVVAKKEFTENLASFRFWMGAVLTVALTLIALLTSAESYEVRRSLWQERSAAEQRNLQKISTFSYLRPVALLSPEPLSILDQGFDARLGTVVRISVFSIPRTAQEELLGNEFMTTWPTVDVTTIVGIVLAFVALLVTCNAMTRESERGTLKSLLAAGVTRRQLLAGKYLGAAMTVGALLLIVMLLGLGFCWSYASEDLAPGHSLRFIGLLGAYLIYLSLTVLLGLVLSLYSRSSSRALARAMVVWLLIVLVTPEVANSLVIDLESIQDVRWTAQRQERRLGMAWQREFDAALSRHPLLQRFSGHSPVYQETADNLQAVLYRYGSARYYDELTSLHAFYSATGRRHAQQVDALRLPAERALRARQQRARAWGAVSPRALLEGLSHSLAGTSIADHDRFLAACRDYRRLFIGYLTAKGAFHSWRWVTDDSPEELFPWPAFFGLAADDVSESEADRLLTLLGDPAGGAVHRRYQARIARDSARTLHLDDLPRFAHSGVDVFAALRRAGGEACGLIVFNFVAAVVAWTAAGRKE
jgi:ABC-2 type transport system permease protein